MLHLTHLITIGRYRLRMLEKIEITRSVDNLADTAVITLPSAHLGTPFTLGDKITEGDTVTIALGYNNDNKTEFQGYVNAIETTSQGLLIRCEDLIYRTRKAIADKEYKNTTLQALLSDILPQVGLNSVSCDYDITYDKYVVYQATAYDILKNIKKESGAHIFVYQQTLHIHPPYAHLGDTARYSFGKNIDRQGLNIEYLDATQRPILAIVNGTDAQGRQISATAGTQGGNQVTINMPGVSLQQSLQQRAQSLLEANSYTGYSGTFTAWLTPYAEPGMAAHIIDPQHPERNGRYYILQTATTYSSAGGKRQITLGRHIGRS